ncbi:MAG: T9SS type A sorting domain-containing protein [Bacteroidia bacterium]
MKTCYIFLFLNIGFLYGQPSGFVLNSEKILRISHSFRERSVCAHEYGGKIFMLGYSLACAGTSCTHASAMVVVDSEGKYLWSRRIGNPQTVSPKSSIADAAGNSYVTGQLSPAPFTDSKSFIYKIDSTGQLIWARLYGNYARHTPTKILVHRDTLYVAGFTDSFDNNDNGFLLKVSPDGEQQWLKYFFHSDYDIKFNDMLLGQSGNLQVAVSFRDWFGQSFASGIYSFDENGNNSGRFAFAGFDDLVSITENSDGSFSGVINKSSLSNGILGMAIFKTNPQISGLEWIRGHNINVSVADAVRGADDEIIITGKYGLSALTGQAYILSVDKLGNHLWNKTYGASAEGTISDLLALDNCQLFACGYANDVTGINPNWYYLRMNQQGETGGIADTMPGFSLDTLTASLTDIPLLVLNSTDTATNVNALFEIGVLVDSTTYSSFAEAENLCQSVGITDLLQTESFQIFPNPTSDFVQIKTFLPASAKPVLDITDLRGNRVFQGSVVNAFTEISLKDISPGIYFIRIKWKDGAMVKKLVVQ